MGNSIAGSFPWFGKGKKETDEEAAEAETTPGKQEGVRWVKVAVNLGPAEAAIIKGRLESQEIPAVVQQEAMGIMLGLTVGPMGSARVLVPEPLAEKALAILNETFEDEPFEPADNDDIPARFRDDPPK